MSERAELHVIRVTTCCLMRSGVRAAEAHAKRDRSRLLKAFGMAVAMGMAACLFASSMPSAVSGQTPGWSLSSEYRVSDLSGDVGDRTEMLDLEVNGLQVLRIGQQGGGSYRPCNVVLLGRGPGDYREDSSQTRVNWNRCVSYFRDDPGWTRILEGVYGEDFYIKSLRVCQTRKKNDRIKGLQSGAVRVTASGEIAETDSQSMTNSDCAEWHRLVRCRPDEVASGIRVRYNGASQTPEITGLELVCRKVVPTVSETARSGLESSDADGAEAESAPEIAIEGNWLRRDSNNPQNDGMRISVEGDRATLTAMPPTGSRRFRTGQVIWQSLTKDGTVRVRGSDGGYYSARVRMEGPDRLHIDIDHNGPGNDQTWVRAGPSIDGDWVLVEASDRANEGLQVRVQGSHAAVRYVPPTASRSFRVGAHTWRNIGGGDQPHLGQLEALTTSQEYRTAQFRLINENRLRVVFDAGGTVQLWVRPGVAEELIAARERGEPLADVPQPQEPADDPLAQGGDVNPPGEERGVEVPEALPPPERACFSTSLLDDGTGIRWGWEIETVVLPDGSAPRTDEGMSAAPGFGADVDRSYAPGTRGHFATITLRRSGRRQHRDMTVSELESRIQTLRSQGYRLTDLEGYTESGSVRYAGVWTRNSNDVTSVPAFGLTSSEYHTFHVNRREAGFRLVDLEAYTTPDGLRYAGIWYRSCDDSNWRQWRDMDRDHYEARVDSLAPHGFQVIDFESYPTPDGQRYAALWEQLPATSFRVRYAQDLTWFLNYHYRYVDLGFRLVDYESYETADGIRYAGIWKENNSRYRFPARAAIDEVIETHRDTNDVPGISVVVIRDGDVVYRRGFGFADRRGQKWAHSKTVYLAASVSKAIGGTLAAKLREDGLVDLTYPTRTYLDPPVGTVCEEVDGNHTCGLTPPSLPESHIHTVEQLFAKTACVWHYDEDKGRYTKEKGGGPAPTSRYYRWRSEALVQIWDNPLLEDCTPGAHYNYSTHGFTFAGAVLEAVTDRDVATLIDQELARPLGITSMRAMFGPDGLPEDYDRAVPYKLDHRTEAPDPDSNPSRETNYENSSWKVLGGGIEVHTLDLARFGWKTLDGQVVSIPALDTLLWRSRTESADGWDVDDDDVPSVGLGWNVGDNAKDPTKSSAGLARDRWAIHGGSARGARSELTIWRDRRLVVGIMSNRRDHDRAGFPFTDLNNEIADAIAAANP